MKIIKKYLLLTFITLSCSGTVMAQQQAADKKPKIADVKAVPDQENSVIQPAAPQIVTGVKAMTVTEKPKPIIPGGEFKPMDTDKPIPAKTPAPEKASVPLLPVLQKQQ